MLDALEPLVEGKKVSVRETARALSGRLAGRPVELLWPLTYMNRSGLAVGEAMRFYKARAQEDLLVIHDDVDLPLGRLRFVRGGGHGGHKGVRSVQEELGTTEFPRLRIGVGRPAGPVPTDKWVLSPFQPEEEPLLKETIRLAKEGVIHFIENGVDSAMNAYNGLRVEVP